MGEYVKSLKKLSIGQKGTLEEGEVWLAGYLSFPCSEWALAFNGWTLYLLNNCVYFCEMNSAYAVFEGKAFHLYQTNTYIRLGTSVPASLTFIILFSLRMKFQRNLNM